MRERRRRGNEEKVEERKGGEGLAGRGRGGIQRKRKGKEERKEKKER